MSSSLLDVREVAGLYGIDPQTASRLARRGIIPGFKSGSGGKTSPYRFRRSVIEADIAMREAAAKSRRPAA